uniref:Histone-lysine N-methyltransferase, H3 lysine-79 specific n=1 Tax=Hydra vulgaris TaxID=6087 RepID=T2M8S1_HYDVU
MAEPKVLKLYSPAYGEPIYYKWPLALTKKHDEAAEIIDTIKLVCEDFPELRYAVDNVMLKDYDGQNYDSMNRLCQRYNKAIRNILTLWKGRAPPPRMFKPPNKELLRHIINLCYSHAIKDPEKLNSYEPFSPEVYGETSFDMIAQIIDDVPHSPDDIFIDLGSGVGQVVLQAAASNQFKECLGVEKADIPAYYAVEMEKEFKKWMDWYGKIYTDFTLEKGDFMDKKWQDSVNEAGFIFVNNFAFGPVVNHHLKNMFQSMKEGAKLVSSREFCSMNFKFNKRNLSELGAMMRISEIRPQNKASVSWTGNTVSYYLHVVDRTRLEKYFSILQKKKEGLDIEEDVSSIYSESNISNETNSCANSGAFVNVETLEDNLDDLYLGTTTRHQWQLLTDTIKQSKKEAIGYVDQFKPTSKEQSSGKQHSETKKNTLLRRSIARKSFESKKKLKKYSPENKKNLSNSSSSSSSMESDLDDPDFVGGNEAKSIENSLDAEVESKLEPSNKKQSDTNCSKEINNNVTSQNEPSKDLENDVDDFLSKLKYRLLDFIKIVNTKEYAEKLSSMIEFEKAKNKLLLREVDETEAVIQNLINDGLKKFSQRLSELDIAVKTPLELLSRSSNLASKHRALENKVLNMEVEVSLLEQKYEDMCNDKVGMKPCGEMLCDDLSTISNGGPGKNDVGTKVCYAIMNALNQRHLLISKNEHINEEIAILEKVCTSAIPSVEQAVSDIKVTLPSAEIFLQAEKPTDKLDLIPKPRPVAFVPPRMLSCDKATILPVLTEQQLVLPPIISISPFSFLNSTLRNSFASEVNPQNKNNIQSETQGYKRSRGRPRKNVQSSEKPITKKVKPVEKSLYHSHLSNDLSVISQYELHEPRVSSEEQKGEGSNCSSVVFPSKPKGSIKLPKKLLKRSAEVEKEKFQKAQNIDESNTMKMEILNVSENYVLKKDVELNKCNAATNLIYSSSQIMLDEKQNRCQEKLYSSTIMQNSYDKLLFDSIASKSINNSSVDDYGNYLPKISNNLEQRLSASLDQIRQSVFVSNSLIRHPQQYVDRLSPTLQDHTTRACTHPQESSNINKIAPEGWSGLTSKTPSELSVALSSSSMSKEQFIKPKDIICTNSDVINNPFYLKQDYQPRKVINKPLNFKDDSIYKTSVVALQESYNHSKYDQSNARSALVDDHFYASLSHLVSSRISANETSKTIPNIVNFTDQSKMTTKLQTTQNALTQSSSIYFPFTSNNQSTFCQKSINGDMRLINSVNFPNSLSFNPLLKSMQEESHPTMTSQVTGSKLFVNSVEKKEEPLKKKRRVNQSKKKLLTYSSDTNAAPITTSHNTSPKVSNFHNPQYRLVYQPSVATDSQNSSFSTLNTFCLNSPISVQSDVKQNMVTPIPNNFIHSQVISWNMNSAALARVSLPTVCNTQVTPALDNILRNPSISNNTLQPMVYTTQPHLILLKPHLNEKNSDTSLQTSFLSINQSASSPTYPPLEKLDDFKT